MTKLAQSLLTAIGEIAPKATSTLYETTIGAGVTFVDVALNEEVNLSETFVILSVISSASNASDAYVRGRLTSATTLRVERGGSTSSVAVKAFVVEFPGATVQQIDATALTPSQSVSIDSVDTSRSFVVLSYSAVLVSTGAYSGSSVRGQLTTSTQLTVQRDSNIGSVAVTTFVVELPEDFVVQSGTTTLFGTFTTTSISSVNLTKSFVVATNSGSASNSDGGLVTTHLANATTLEFNRFVSPAPLVVDWFVVETPASSTIVTSQHQLAASGASDTVAVDPAENAFVALAGFTCGANVDYSMAMGGRWLTDDTTLRLERVGTTSLLTARVSVVRL
jgi:hypothetical protein